MSSRSWTWTVRAMEASGVGTLDTAMLPKDRQAARALPRCVASHKVLRKRRHEARTNRLAGRRDAGVRTRGSVLTLVRALKLGKLWMRLRDKESSVIAYARNAGLTP